MSAHNSSATHFTNICPGSTPFVTLVPATLSSHRLINLLTTGNDTSASSNARRTSFSGALTFSAFNSFSPLNRAHALSNFSDIPANASATGATTSPRGGARLRARPRASNPARAPPSPRITHRDVITPPPRRRRRPPISVEHDALIVGVTARETPPVIAMRPRSPRRRPFRRRLRPHRRPFDAPDFRSRTNARSRRLRRSIARLARLALTNERARATRNPRSGIRRAHPETRRGPITTHR